MKKLKVGDWVKWGEEVARIIKVYEPFGFIEIVFGELEQTTVPFEALTKLNVRFKPFDIELEFDCGWPRWGAHKRHKRIGYITFSCVKVGNFYDACIDPSKGQYISADFPSIEQAKDWLELRYAIMLVGARS